MATEAQTPEPISEKKIEDEIKSLSCDQLHTTVTELKALALEKNTSEKVETVRSEDPAEKAILAEDENSKDKIETPPSDNVNLPKVDDGYNPSSETVENSTKPEVTQNNSSILLETAMETSWKVETVLEKSNGASDVGEDRGNQIPIEKEAENETQFQKEQEVTEENYKITKDSEAEVTDLNTDNETEEEAFKKPSELPSEEKNDENVSLILLEGRIDDGDLEKAYSVSNEQKLDSTEACSTEAEVMTEEQTAKKPDISIDERGAPVETVVLKYEIEDEKVMDDIEVAEEEEQKKEETSDNKFGMLSVSEEMEGNMIHESSKMVSEDQTLDTSVESEKLERSLHMGSGGQNAETIEERDKLEEASSISIINLDNASVSRKDEGIENIENLSGLALEASDKAPEARTDIGSVSATETFVNAFKEEECIEKHIDTDAEQVKQELVETSFQEDRIEDKEQEKASDLVNVVEDLETSDASRKIESEKAEREENPHDSPKDLSIAVTSADPSIQNDEMKSRNIKETNDSACVSACEDKILEPQNVIQNIEEVHEKEVIGNDNLQAASITIVTEETNLQKAEPEGDRLEETSDLASDERSLETPDILPVAQPSVKESVEGNEPENTTKPIPEEMIAEKIEASDFASDEKSLQANDTALHQEEVGCEKLGETSNLASELPTVNDSDKADKVSPEEETPDVLPVVRTLVEKSLQKDEIPGDEAEKETEQISEEKTAEIKESDLAYEEKIQEADDSSLQQEVKDVNTETSNLIYDHPAVDGSDNAEEKPDALPIVQALLQESLQTDKIQSDEVEKVTETIPEEKDAIEVPGLASEEKILEASDKSLQHGEVNVAKIEETSILVSGLHTINESKTTDEENTIVETPDVLPVVQNLIEKSLQDNDIPDDEAEKETKQASEEKNAEEIRASGLAKIQEADDTSLQQEAKHERIKETSKVLYDLPTVDGSDNAEEEKSDGLPVKQAFAEESLQMDKIQSNEAEKETEPVPEEKAAFKASGQASEEKILEANEVEGAKIEEASNLVSELHAVNERDEESPTEETPDVLPVVQTLLEKSLQNDEIQGDKPEKATAHTSEEKTAEEIEVSDIASEEKIQEADDTILLQKEIEGEKIEGTLDSEFPEVNESKNTDKEISIEVKQDVLPASKPLVKESLQKEKIQGEPEKAPEPIPEGKTSEAIEVSDFAPDEKVLEANDTSLHKEEAAGSKIAETSTLVSELSIEDKSDNVDKQIPTEEKIDGFPIAQAFVDESLQKDETQSVEHEKATEPIPAEKIEEENENEASDQASESKCIEATDSSLQHEDEGMEFEETSHLVSEISTVDKATEPIPAEKISEENEASDQASERECKEATDSSLQHEDEGVGIEETSHLVSEISTVDKATEPIPAEKISEENEASDHASERECIEATDSSLQHEDEDVEIKETSHLVSEISTVDESNNTNTQIPTEEKADVLLVTQASDEESSWKDEIHRKEPERAAELIPEQKTAEAATASELPYEEKSPETNDTGLQHKEVEDVEMEERANLVGELPTVDESNNADKQGPTEEKADTLSIEQALVDESLQKDEIQGNKPVESTEEIDEEKISEEIKVSDLPYEEKCPTAIDTVLQHEEVKGVKTEETSHLVSELPTVDESSNADKQISTMEKADSLPAVQELVGESLQKDEIHGKEKIEEVSMDSDLPFEEKILEGNDPSLQHEEVEGTTIEEPSNSACEIPSVDESNKADKQSPIEEKTDALSIEQALVDESLQKDEIQGNEPVESTEETPEEKILEEVKASDLAYEEKSSTAIDKATEHISEEKTAEEIKVSDVASEEKIQEADDASLLQKEVEGEKIEGTLDSEFPEVNENEKTDKEISTEVKQDVLPASQPFVKESLQKDEIQGKESEKATEPIPEEKTSEAIEVSDSAPDTTLHIEEAEGSKIAETSTLVSELSTDNKSDNVEMQTPTEEKIDGFSIVEAFVDESLQKDETQSIEHEKATEPIHAEKIAEENEASDIASERKCLEVTDSSFQHEDEGVEIEETSHLVSEISTVDEATEPIPAEKISEENGAPDKKCLEATDSSLHHEDEGVEIEEISHLVSDISVVDESDNANKQIPAEEKGYVLHVTQASDEESLCKDEIHEKEPERAAEVIPEQEIAEATTASELEYEEKSPETNNTGLQHEEVENVKIEECTNLVGELPTVDESNNADKQSPTEEKADALSIEQALVDESLQKDDEIQGKEPVESTEEIPEEKISEVVKASDLAYEEKSPTAIDPLLQHEEVEGAKTEEISNLVSELPTVDESSNADNQIPTKEKADSLPIVQELVGESLQKDEIHGTEKIAEVSMASELACEEKILEGNDPSLQQEEVDGTAIEEPSKSVCEIPSVDGSDNADKQSPIEEKTDAFPIAQAVVDESLQKDDIQGIDPEKATEPIPEEKIVEENEASDLASEEKSLEAIDKSLQHEEVEGAETDETSHLVSEISTVNESDSKDEQILTEEKADSLPIAQALVEESSRKGEIHSKEPEGATELLPEKKTTEEIVLEVAEATKILNTEKHPDEIPATEAPVEETIQDTEIEEPVKLSDMVSENQGVESIKAEADSGEIPVDDNLDTKVDESVTTTTKDDIPTESEKQEMNPEFSVATQTTEEACLQSEVGWKSDQVTEVMSEGTGEYSNQNMQKKSLEPSIETASVEDVEGSQKEVEKVDEIPKSEPKEHVSEARDTIEVSESKIPDEKKESEESIGISSPTCISEDVGPSTDAKAGDKFEEILKQVSDEQDLKATDSSSMLENEIQKEDTTREVNIEATYATQSSEVICLQKEEIETDNIEKASEIVHKDQCQSISSDQCEEDTRNDKHDESSMIEAQVEDNLKKDTEETEYEKVEKATSNDFEFRSVETIVGNESTKIDVLEEDENPDMVASVQEKTEKGEDPVASVYENIEKKFKDSGNEGIAVCEDDRIEEAAVEASFQTEQLEDKMLSRSYEFHAEQKISEISDASKNSIRETPNNGETSEYTLQKDTREGEKNEQSLEMVTEGIEKEKDFPENEDPVKKLEESIQEGNQEEVKKGTDKLETEKDTTENVNFNEENLGTAGLSEKIETMDTKDDKIQDKIIDDLPVTNALVEALGDEAGEKHEEVNDFLSKEQSEDVDANDSTQLDISKVESEPESASEDQSHNTITETETTNIDGLVSSLASAEESSPKEAPPEKAEENMYKAVDMSESTEGMPKKEETSDTSEQKDKTGFDQMEKPSDKLSEGLNTAGGGDSIEDENIKEVATLNSLDNISITDKLVGEGEGLQENKEHKKHEETEPECEAEDQSYKANDVNDIVIPNEEVSGEFETIVVDKDIHKQREEKEGGAKDLDTLSTVDDPIEESILESKEQKKLVEEIPQSEYQNQSYEAHDTVDTTMDRETEEDKRSYSTEKKDTEAVKGEEDPSDIVDTSVVKTVSTEESAEREVGEKHQEATDFTPEEHVLDTYDNIKLDTPIDTESEKPQVDSESVPDERSQDNTAEKTFNRIEISMDNECSIDALSDPQASVQENTQNEAIQMKTEERYKEQDEVSKSMDSEELEKTCESEGIDDRENKEREIEKEEPPYKDMEEDKKEKEQVEKPTHVVFGGVAAVSADENVEKQINTASVREVEEKNLQENKIEGTILEEAAPESKPEVPDHETKEADDTAKNEIPNEGCEGLEGEGAVIILDTASVQVDTVEENLQKDREDKRLSEAELEAEKQIFEMKDLNDNTKDESPNEEIILDKDSSLLSTERSCQTDPIKKVETVFLKDEDPNPIVDASPVTMTSAAETAKEDVPKGLEGEGAVLELNNVSVGVDTVEENLQEDRENKKLSEPELEAENQIFEMKDTYDNTKDESPNEEIIQDKYSSLLSTERSYQTDPTEKKETVLLKDEKDPNPVINASPIIITSAEETARQEVGDNLENASDLGLKKQIHEAISANEKNIEFATTKTSAPESQFEVEKLKDSPADLAFVHDTSNLSDTTKATAPSAIEALGVIDASPVAPASNVQMLQQEGEKLYEASTFVFEEKIEEAIDANEAKEICITRCEEVPYTSSIEPAKEERNIAENELEDQQKLQNTSNLVPDEQIHEKIKAREIDEIAIAADEKPQKQSNDLSVTQASDEIETTEISNLIPESPIHETSVVGNSMDQKVDESKVDSKRLVTVPDLASDEKIHDTIPASDKIESQNKNFDFILADQDLGKEMLPKQDTEKLEGAQVTLQNIEIPKEFSDETSEENPQTPGEISSQKAEHEEANQVEISKKQMGIATEDSIEEIEASDTGKVWLSDLLQKSTKETLEMGEHFIQEKNPTASEDDSQNKPVEAVQVEEEKTDEEEDHDEHKKEELGSDGVIVEVSRDVNLKIVHKKSHNILSGVGSKVKHSIAKVKKAITGKSSHPKSLPSK